MSKLTSIHNRLHKATIDWGYRATISTTTSTSNAGFGQTAPGEETTLYSDVPCVFKERRFPPTNLATAGIAVNEMYDAIFNPTAIDGTEVQLKKDYFVTINNLKYKITGNPRKEVFGWKVLLVKIGS